MGCSTKASGQRTWMSGPAPTSLSSVVAARYLCIEGLRRPGIARVQPFVKRQEQRQEDRQVAVCEGRGEGPIEGVFTAAAPQSLETRPKKQLEARRALEGGNDVTARVRNG